MPSTQASSVTLADLESLYDAPLPPSVVKEADRITPEYRAWIEASPFAVLATCGPEGLDCSPRGDGPGFVRIVDERTLLIPDRRGNNRIDSLRNVVRDPRLALLFLVPGMGETLRVNGRGAVLADPALNASFAVAGKEPRTVLAITVEAVFFQCSRAMVRADLWNPEKRAARGALPTAGQMLAAMSGGSVGGEDYDRALPERVRTTLY